MGERPSQDRPGAEREKPQIFPGLKVINWLLLPPPLCKSSPNFFSGLFFPLLSKTIQQIHVKYVNIFGQPKWHFSVNRLLKKCHPSLLARYHFLLGTGRGLHNCLKELLWTSNQGVCLFVWIGAFAFCLS